MTIPVVEESTRTQATSFSNRAPKEKLALPPRRRSRVKPKMDRLPARTKARRSRRPKAVSPRPGSKTAKVLALLKKPQGAGLKELLKATGWQPHSVRGFLSGIVTKKMGLKVISTKAESGERRYAIRP